MKKNQKTIDKSVDEILNLASGTFPDVDTIFTVNKDGEQRLKRALPKEKLNVLLCELLMYFAAVEGDEDAVKQLECIREKDKDWHLHWLNSEPWLSHLFFRDWLIGQRAFALAGNELVGMPNAFEEDMKEQLMAYLQNKMGFDAILVIEKLIAQYEELNSTEMRDSAVDLGIPDFGVILQTLWTYACDAGREDLCDRILTLAQGCAGGKNSLFQVKRQTVRQFISCAEHFRTEPLFKGLFNILARLPGCYDVVADKVHKNRTPLGFERNLMLLGKVDIAARGIARDRLARAKFAEDSENRHRQRVLLSCGENAEICRRLKAFEVNGAIPRRIGEIAGRELLDKLLLKMLHRSAISANSSSMGEHRPIRIESKCLRNGYQIKFDELEMFLYGAALEVLCYLKGWERWTGDRDHENTTQLLNEVGRVQGEMDMPVLRFLYGGETGRNLIEYFYDLTYAVLDSKISKSKKPPEIVSIDTPSQVDDNGKERTIGDALSSQGDGISDQPDSMGAVENHDEKVEAKDFVRRLMTALRRFDTTFADHFWLENFGMRGFVRCKIYGEDNEELWRKLKDEQKIEAKQIRVLLKIGRGNTNWYGRMAKKFASELWAGTFHDIIKTQEEIQKIAKYFSQK